MLRKIQEGNQQGTYPEKNVGKKMEFDLLS